MTVLMKDLFPQTHLPTPLFLDPQSLSFSESEAEREIGTGEMFWAVQCSEGHGAVSRGECGSLLSGQEQGNVIIILSRV